MAIPSNIILTGKVYIKYTDNNIVPLLGDVLLVLHDDAITTYHINDSTNNISGHIRAKIYDGVKWQNIDITEFCLNKENKLAKKQRVLDSLRSCRDVIANYQGVMLYKTYRGHFTREEYIPEPYIRGTKYEKTKKNS